MRNVKVTISMPDFLLKQIEHFAMHQKLSRSAFITNSVKKDIAELTEQEIIDSFNLVFKDKEIIAEQKVTAERYNTLENLAGQEW